MAGISPCDVLDFFSRVGDYVGELFVPAGFVDQRRIARGLARIAVEPAFLGERVDFRPDVIGFIDDVPKFGGKIFVGGGRILQTQF